MLREAWVRSTVLADPGIERRVNALDMVIFIAGQDASNPDRPERMNFWPLSVGFRDLRRALAAFQRREPLPEPDLPDAKGIIALAHRAGIDGVWEDLDRRNVL
jgi:hypothetical protein